MFCPAGRLRLALNRTKLLKPLQGDEHSISWGMSQVCEAVSLLSVSTPEVVPSGEVRMGEATLGCWTSA